MTLCEDYQIGGKALLAPDAGVELTLTDIDAADAGRDESGYMHRQVVRRRVRTWNFSYAFLGGDELAYMEALLAGQDTFSFRFPGGTCTAYCSNHTVTVENLRLGIYRGCKFSIIEC